MSEAHKPEYASRLAGSPRKRAFALGAALFTAALAGAVVFGPAAETLFRAKPAIAQDFSRAPMSFADLAEKVRPAVVSVYTKNGSLMRGFGGRGQDFFNFEDLPPGHPFREFFEQFRRRGPGAPGEENRPARAQGSGFLISEDGLIVTNNHVIDKAEEITVIFDNDEKYEVELVGTDPRTDLALLKIKGEKKFKHYLQFADKTPRVGDWVLAVGNPFGLGGTVTAGIVSAMSRDIGSGPYDYLQIDAAVNRGNSGGPSVNLNGEVVGVNTAIFSPSGGNVGIAFAIPADLAREVVEQLRTERKVSRGWLGVSIQNVNAEIAESLDMKEAKGALVTNILEKGPAAASDIKVGDVIIEVNGKKIEDSRDLARTIASLRPDSEARLLIHRKGERKQVTLKLGTFPNQDQLAALDPRQRDGKELRDLGLSLSPASEVQGAGDKGVAIVQVDPGSEAAEKGLRQGDVIVEAGGVPVATPEDVADQIREAREKGKSSIFLQVQSRRQTRFVALKLGDGAREGGRR